MGTTRVLATLTAAATAAVLALSTASAAGSERVADEPTEEATLTAPPAPRHVQPASAVAAVSPTISPSATTAIVRPGETYSCPLGNLCTFVWDPTRSAWKQFFLYYCHRYALSNWFGVGYFRNNQTDNASAVFYNKNGGVLEARNPGSTMHQRDWDPVWYIRNCW